MEWKPIDTAPKDGTWVQIARSSRYLGTAKFDPNSPYAHFGEEATHWMPLPEPPA